MDTIGQKIRETLKSRHMKSRDLAQMTGLKAGTIDNIIYGRSRRYNWLQIISEKLNIELVPLEGGAANTNYYPSIYHNRPESLDLDLYSSALQMLAASLKQQNVTAAKDMIDLLSSLTYDFLQQGLNRQEVTNYIIGMIHLAKAKRMVHEQKRTEQAAVKALANA